MGEYIRFDVYLPIRYSVTKIDPLTGKRRRFPKDLDEELVGEFISECLRKYKGATRANPMAPHPLKGWWRRKTIIDLVTYIFVLVDANKEEQALSFFKGWQKKFEEILEQDIVLITHYTLHTISDLS